MTRRRVPVPAAISRTAIVLAMVIGALYMVGRSTGAGWVVVMLCLAIGVMVAGIVWPAVAVATVGVGADAPRDAAVGHALAVRVSVTGHARAIRVRLVSPRGTWVHADAPSNGVMTVVPEMRGVVPRLELHLRSNAPLGFVTWSRRVAVELDRPIEIAPAPSDAPAPVMSDGTDDRVQLARRSRSGTEMTRGVREYAPGDAFRLVHWPATARSGSVMVRELDGPRHPRLGLVVDLRPCGAAAERAASRAAAIAYDALSLGVEVTLHTSEALGPMVTNVSTVRDAGRCLARAVDGPLPSTGFAPGTTVVRVTP